MSIQTKFSLPIKTSPKDLIFFELEIFKRKKNRKKKGC